MLIDSYLAKRVSNYEDRNSLGSRLRARRMAPLLHLIREAHGKYGLVNLVDIGGTADYWRNLPAGFVEENKLNITVVNLSEVIKRQVGNGVNLISADACDLSRFAEREFHIAHSNSVVEHVGDWRRMVKFAHEISRVARSYFVQTPNYWFPIEAHCMTPFFHWLPKPMRIWFVMHFKLGHWRKASNISDAVEIVESARLLSKKMFSSLFPDGVILTEYFMKWPKSFVAIRTEFGAHAKEN